MKWRRLLIVFLILLLFLGGGVWWLLLKTPAPESISYGASFNTLYARELSLDWQQTYDAMLDDLQIRKFRLAAHWPMVEPEQGQYSFSELDYQIERAEEVDATVVLAVGRRLPRWPECHIPDWAAALSWEEQKTALRGYITAVVERYRDHAAVRIWQVENEPYLEVFAHDHCGDLDETFLQEEIALVRSLDPTRPILLTDSGNLGSWAAPYRQGDQFGTSVYVHFWTPELGQFRTVLPPWWYRVKTGLMQTLYGEKDTTLIELSAEPWLVEPITDVPLSVQYARMNPELFGDIIDYAAATHLTPQYLWGVEWWYWLHQQGKPEMWERGRELFRSGRM